VSSKKGSVDAKAAVTRIEKALEEVAKLEAEVAPVEEIASSEGVVLVGDICSAGDLEVTTDDVVIEEPRIVAMESL